MASLVLNFGTGVGTLSAAVVRFRAVDKDGNASRIEAGSGGVEYVNPGSIVASVVGQTEEYVDVRFEKGVLGDGVYSSETVVHVKGDGDPGVGLSPIFAEVVCTHVGASAVGFGVEVLGEEFEVDLSVPADGIIVDSPVVDSGTADSPAAL